MYGFFLTKVYIFTMQLFSCGQKNLCFASSFQVFPSKYIKMKETCMLQIFSTRGAILLEPPCNLLQRQGLQLTQSSVKVWMEFLRCHLTCKCGHELCCRLALVPDENHCYIARALLRLNSGRPWIRRPFCMKKGRKGASCQD